MLHRVKRFITPLQHYKFLILIIDEYVANNNFHSLHDYKKDTDKLSIKTNIAFRITRSYLLGDS